MEAVIQETRTVAMIPFMSWMAYRYFFRVHPRMGFLNEVLYLQPEDLETPEELLNAFDMGVLPWSRSAAYVRDVLERQVGLRRRILRHTWQWRWNGTESFAQNTFL